MKKLIFVSALVFASGVASANTSYTHLCTTDTGKRVEVGYSYLNASSQYVVDRVVIDGTNYTASSQLMVMRGSGTIVTVSQFRDGQSLQLMVSGPQSPSYRLGNNGSVRPMQCEQSSQRDQAPKNDGI